MATKNTASALGNSYDSGPYQAESDLRCLLQCEEIKKDKKRYAAALKKAQEQMECLEEIQEEKDEEGKEPADDETETKSAKS